MRREAFEDVLRRELLPVTAPDWLWAEVETRRAANVRTSASPRRLVLGWSVAGFSVLLLLPVVWMRYGGANAPEVDIRPYLGSTVDGSAMAVSQNGRAGAEWADGYTVAQRRVMDVKGEPVKQYLLNVAGNAVTLFVASPKVRFGVGSQKWEQADVEGLACKRLNTERLRTVLFPCAKEVCVLVCKTCSTPTFRSLMGQVSLSPAELR